MFLTKALHINYLLRMQKLNDVPDITLNNLFNTICHTRSKNVAKTNKIQKLEQIENSPQSGALVYILRPETSNKKGLYNLYWKRFHYDENRGNGIFYSEHTTHARLQQTLLNCFDRAGFCYWSD